MVVSFSRGCTTISSDVVIEVDLDKLMEDNIHNKYIESYLLYKSYYLLPYNMKNGINKANITYFVSTFQSRRYRGKGITALFVAVVKKHGDREVFMSNDNSLESMHSINPNRSFSLVNNRIFRDKLLMTFYRSVPELGKMNDTIRLQCIDAAITTMERYDIIGKFYIDVKLGHLFMNKGRVYVGDIDATKMGDRRLIPSFPSPRFDINKDPTQYDREWSLITLIISTYISSHSLDTTDNVKLVIKASRKIQQGHIFLDVAEDLLYKVHGFNLIRVKLGLSVG